jgi:hypothetical protein
MKNEKLLLLIAEKLESIGGAPFCMTDYAQDALYYAAQVPELQARGLVWHANDNEPRVWFKKKHQHLAAVEKLFDLSPIHAQFLFGHVEMTPEGYHTRSPFATGKRRDGTPTSDGYERWAEPPGWTAARIRMFVREFPEFPSYARTKVSM